MSQQERFLAAFRKVFAEAMTLVLRREELGRNEVIDLPGMFPRGAEDPIFVIYMKAARSLGEIQNASSIREVRSELIDIVNYAAFGVALIDMEKEDVGWTDTTDLGTRSLRGAEQVPPATK